MYKNFKLTEEEKKQILEMHQSGGYKKPINEQEKEGFSSLNKPIDDKGVSKMVNTSLDLNSIVNIFKSKGYVKSSNQGYKIYGHKETTGPLQNPKTGEFYWNYEFYVPIKSHPEEGIEGLQLWIDRRRETPKGGTESENIIVGLTGPNHKVIRKRNGNVVGTETMSTDAVMEMINNYDVSFK